VNKELDLAMLVAAIALFLSAARVCDMRLRGAIAPCRELAEFVYDNIVFKISDCQAIPYLTHCKLAIYVEVPPPPRHNIFNGLLRGKYAP
jgi:hypothetical protein